MTNEKQITRGYSYLAKHESLMGNACQKVMTLANTDPYDINDGVILSRENQDTRMTVSDMHLPKDVEGIINNDIDNCDFDSALDDLDDVSNDVFGGNAESCTSTFDGFEF